MDLDLIFVGALLLGAFAIPAFVSAYSDRRWPIISVLMLAAAGYGLWFTNQQEPDRYTVAAVDDIVVEVLGRYLN